MNHAAKGIALEKNVLALITYTVLTTRILGVTRKEICAQTHKPSMLSLCACMCIGAKIFFL